MKQSPVQQRIIQQMRAGARLRWNCVAGKFELQEGQVFRSVQARTIAALEAAGLVERECLGDVLLSPLARPATAFQRSDSAEWQELATSCLPVAARLALDASGRTASEALMARTLPARGTQVTQSLEGDQSRNLVGAQA
jgi:hypothetical protein